MSDDLSARLSRLETIEASRDLLAEYAAAVDGQDLDRLARVFAPDAVLTAPGRRFEGVDAIVEFYRTAFADDPSPRRHFVTNVRVDAATATTAALSAYFLYTAGTAAKSILGWGRYTDRYGLVGTDLRMTSKDIVVDFRGPVEATWGAAVTAAPQ